MEKKQNRFYSQRHRQRDPKSGCMGKASSLGGTNQNNRTFTQVKQRQGEI